MTITAAAAGRGARLLADVTRRMEQVLGSVAGIVTAAESIAGQAGGPPCGQSLRRDDFTALRPLVTSLLGEHAGLAAGAGVVLAPQTLADAPRCITWWWADRSGRVVPLEVDTDPDSAEFYDYTTTEWYREPERTGAPTLAGPYVDFICTHEYTFTLAAPVRYAGRFIGVAAADILATQVERLVLPGLYELSQCGMGPDRRSPDGRSPHELSPHELSPDGRSPHELSPHELSPHELSSGGRSPSGRSLSGQGMSGRSLSGRDLSGRSLSGRGLSGRGLSGPGQVAVLASGHGRVIASTSASLPPGSALPRPPHEAGFVLVAGPGAGQPPRLLPWSLLTMPMA